MRLAGLTRQAPRFVGRGGHGYGRRQRRSRGFFRKRPRGFPRVLRLSEGWERRGKAHQPSPWATKRLQVYLGAESKRCLGEPGFGYASRPAAEWPTSGSKRHMLPVPRREDYKTRSRPHSAPRRHAGVIRSRNRTDIVGEIYRSHEYCEGSISSPHPRHSKK